MKLVKQTKLHFREGNSDKVYEADICEVAPDQYVVNFRYGKRGANLTEGTKTVAPVDMKKAQDLFDKLIKEKTAKGYQDVTAGGEAKAVTAFERTGDAATDRKKAILWHLELGVSNPPKQRQKRYNIKRAIWKAGQLKMTEATPHLLGLFGKGLQKETQLYNYCILWSLGYCAQDSELKPQALAKLAEFINDQSEQNSDMVRRIAKSSYLLLANEAEKQAFAQSLKSTLPEVVKAAVDNPKKIASLLDDYSERANASSFAFMENLYLYNLVNPTVKKQIYQWVKESDFKPNFFKYIRHLYKIALHQQDIFLMGAVGYKLQSEFSRFAGSRARVDYRWINAKNELAKPNSRIAYSQQTRNKLNRDFKQTVLALGEEKSLKYVQLATAFLLHYDDNIDRGYAWASTTWYCDDKGSWQQKVVYVRPEFGEEKHHLFNLILYKNSDRYQIFEQGYTRCAAGYDATKTKAQATIYPKREEQYPELWDQMPLAYVNLLMQSKCAAVVEFALRALQQHPQYQQIIARFSKEDILQLLNSKVELTANWGLDFIKKQLDPSEFEVDFILKLVSSDFAAVSKYGKECLNQNLPKFLRSVDLMFQLISSPNNDIYQFGRKHLSAAIEQWDLGKKKAFIAKFVSSIIQLPERPNNPQRFQELTAIFTTNLAAELHELGVSVISDLIHHPYLGNKLLGLELIKLNQCPAERLPLDLINYLVQNSEDRLRGAGIELINGFSLAALRENLPLLQTLFVSTNPNNRRAADKLLDKVLAYAPQAGEELINAFVPYMLKKETWEGLHSLLFQTLSGKLSEHLQHIHRDLIFRLLNVSFSAAHHLAGILLERYVPADTMSLRSIVKLGSHETLAIRQLCFKIYNQNLARVKYELDDALRLLDSDWDDTRAFAMGYFSQHIGENEWTPELLVSICDNVRADVQQYGTQLVNRFFKSENGNEYMLKLSQHPRPNVMQHVTNYLQAYAHNNPDNLRRLELYFISILSQVNKARAGKERVFSFLHQQGLLSADLAQWVATIMDRISATVAIGDKATCVEILRDLKKAYPATQTLLSLHSI